MSNLISAILMASALALIFTFAGMLSTKQRNGYDTGEKDIASRQKARSVFVLLVVSPPQ